MFYKSDRLAGQVGENFIHMPVSVPRITCNTMQHYRIIQSSGWPSFFNIEYNTPLGIQSFARIRGMILKFRYWCDISVTSNSTYLKIVPNNNKFLFYTPL